MPITDDEFHHIVNYMKKNYGINLSKKRTLIVGRLENFLARNGFNTYGEFMKVVEKDPSGRRGEELINALTTNHTYFMREFEHIEFFRDTILPQLRQKEQARRVLRIWSAASSTGEEPYTIAMVLRDFFGNDSIPWDTALLATDISTRVLEKAKAGIYMEEQMDPLPETWKKKYFIKKEPGKFSVTDALKKEVIYRQFNLMDPFQFRSKFQVVFIRNVMIYFDEETKKEVVRKICEYLEPGGYLIIGTAESIDRNAAPLRYIKPSIYQRL